MTNYIAAAPAWSTASFTEAATASPMDMSALHEHLKGCNGAHQRWMALNCAADAFHGFVTTRFVTTMAIVALLVGVGLLAL